MIINVIGHEVQQFWGTKMQQMLCSKEMLGHMQYFKVDNQKSVGWPLNPHWHEVLILKTATMKIWFCKDFLENPVLRFSDPPHHQGSCGECFPSPPLVRRSLMEICGKKLKFMVVWGWIYTWENSSSLRRRGLLLGVTAFLSHGVKSAWDLGSDIEHVLFLPARAHFQGKLFKKAVCQGEGTPLQEAEMVPQGKKLWEECSASQRKL